MLRNFFLAGIAAILVSPIAAQAQPAGNTKIGFIYSTVFSFSDRGITRIKNANTQVANEFKARENEYLGMVAKIQNYDKEIASMTEQFRKTPNGPVTADSIRFKKEERDSFARTAKFKQDELNSDYQKRKEVLLTPILDEIGTALQDFAKLNGLGVVFDLSNIREPNSIFVINESMDYTDAFVKYFNARPPAAPKPATPAPSRPATPPTRPN